MADDVRARLVYDVSSAQASVRSLGQDLDKLERPIALSVVVNDAQLVEAVANVALLKEEVVSLVGEIALDSSQLVEAETEVEAVDATLQDLTGTIEVDDSSLIEAEAEAESLDAVLAGGLDGVVEVDDSSVTEAISDVDSLSSALGDITAPDISLGPVVDDLNEASASAGDLAGAATSVAGGLLDVGTAGSVATGELGSVAGVTGVLGTAMTGAVDGVGQLASGLGLDLGPALAAVGIGVGTLAAGLGILGSFTDLVVGKATAAESASQRFNLVLGDQAEAVSNVNLAGFDESLSTLVNRLGSGTSAIREADASLFQLGKSTGATGEQIALTVEQVNLLATRAVALNPSLGSVGEVAEKLQGALARGGRFAGNLGLALSSTEINARAAEIALARGSSTVEQFDKIAAGAAISTEKLGDSLKTDIEAGADNVAFDFKRIELEFNKALTALGKPLISPTLDLLTSALPIGVDLATLLGNGARTVIPIVTSLVSAVEPLITILSTELTGALTEISPIIEEAGRALGDAFKDPAVVDAVHEIALASADSVKELAPLIPLLLELSPIFTALAPFLELTAIHLTGVNDALSFQLAVLESIGLIQQNRPDEVFLPIEPADIQATREAAEAQAALAMTEEEAAKAAMEEEESIKRVTTAMRDAEVSVDDLASALKDAFDEPTQLDAAVQLAEFEKLKADIFKDIAETRKLPFGEQDLAQLKVIQEAADGFADFVASPGFDPSTLNAQRDALIAQAQAAGVSAENMGLLRDSLFAVSSVEDVRIQVAIEQGIEEISQLKSTAEILASLKANPEIATALRVFGVPEGLESTEEMKQALDILDGTVSEPEISADADKLIEATEDSTLRIEELDALKANPTIGVNDQATPKLDQIAFRAAVLAQTGIDVVVNASGNAISEIDRLRLVTEAAERALQRLQVAAVVNTALSVVRGFEYGGIVEHDQLIRAGEGNKRELILPLEQPWDRQMSLLNEAGVLERLEAQFTAAEQARASSLNAAVAWAPSGAREASVSARDLDAIAVRMEEAARTAARESRPITAEITVPAVADPNVQARILRRKLARL